MNCSVLSGLNSKLVSQLHSKKNRHMFLLLTCNTEFISVIVWGDDMQDSEIGRDKTINIPNLMGKYCLKDLVINRTIISVYILERSMMEK
jgi:hypothetical protein